MKGLKKLQRYLTRTRQAAVMDAVGGRLLTWLGCTAWFCLLWNVGLPAIFAGLALTILLCLAWRFMKRRTVQRRETALRERLGGEMVMERLLLTEKKKAHFQMALLLGTRWPLHMERMSEDGVICCLPHEGGASERLLVSCWAEPEGTELGVSQVLALRRACKREKADRAVVCLTCGYKAEALKFAEETPYPVRILPREEMIALAGHAWPATDEQLVELGKRRKKRFPLQTVLDRVLAREKTRKYMLSFASLALMYAFTRRFWYLIPACICLMLAALCKLLPRERKAL